VERIQVVNGESKDLEGRVAAMIVFLAEQAEKLNGTERIKIEFNCAGASIKPSLTFFEDGPTIRI